MTKVFYIATCVFLITAKVYAQDDNEAIYLKKDASIDVSIIADSLRIVEHFVSEVKFLKNFERNSRASVYYSDFDPVTNLTAVTLIPFKLGFKRKEVSTITTEDIFQSGVFYGDYKRKEFVFPAVVNGAIGKLEYTKHITDAHLLNSFFFDTAIPVAKAKFSITFPKGVVVRYKLFGKDTARIIRDEKTDAGKTTYTWQLTDVIPYKYETDAPSRLYTVPHLVVYIESFETKKGKQNVLSGVQDLYNWYASHIRRMPINSNSELKQLVNQLTKSLPSEKEKAKAVFQWVQHNIKYVAFENGMAGFIPRSSSDVYIKRYGDCKDMANLLKDMLTMAGLEAYHTWIGTRSKPYTYEQMPTAIVNNHMICCVKINGEHIFLDATDPFVSFGRPSSMIQDKEGLVGINSTEFEITKIPVTERYENGRKDTVRMRLQPDGVTGQFASTLTGYRKNDLDIKSLKAQLANDKEDYILNFFSIGENNIQISHLTTNGLGSRETSSSIAFDFTQPGYSKNVNDKIYINLNLNKPVYKEQTTLKSREQQIEQDYRYEDRLISILTIPDGYSLSFVPKNMAEKWSDFGITTSYRKQEHTVILERIIYTDFLYLDKPQFEQWSAFIESVNTVCQQSIILTRNK